MTRPQPARDVSVRAPAERVWDALLVQFTDYNIPIENMERASWFLRTQEMRIPGAPDLVDCGKTWAGESRAANFYVRVRYTVLLRPAGDSTAVRLQMAARVIADAGPLSSSLDETECVSRGVFEARFIERLKGSLESHP